MGILELRDKHYLGDGAYVGFDGYGALVLVTEDGIQTTNIVVLESDPFNNLMEYIERHK